MTNLQKIQQETDDAFKYPEGEFCDLPLMINDATNTGGETGNPPFSDIYIKSLKSFIHSRESIAYKAGYDEGYADCANDVKKLSK